MKTVAELNFPGRLIAVGLRRRVETKPDANKEGEGAPPSPPAKKEPPVTDPDLDRCEVTRALVGVRKLTGQLAPSSKFPDPAEPGVQRALDEAQRLFDEERDRLVPVVVI